ncbi:hypothetical protein LCE32_34000 [Streptomyces sp. 7G]|uniref:hypothetical protein n=1 Tax=Streptomyces sp. 7G TaxID=2877241 RepID=UPI001CD299CB|nr:hypothetical protein [Streptomyces sp. 7G]MCA1274989.1 hypothetical protein [Streptomyces sp. 7G]
MPGRRRGRRGRGGPAAGAPGAGGPGHEPVAQLPVACTIGGLAHGAALPAAVAEHHDAGERGVGGAVGPDHRAGRTTHAYAYQHEYEREHDATDGFGDD